MTFVFSLFDFPPVFIKVTGVHKDPLYSPRLAEAISSSVPVFPSQEARMGLGNGGGNLRKKWDLRQSNQLEYMEMI